MDDYHDDDADDSAPRPRVHAQMHFCPIDQNLLHVTNEGSDTYRWYCLTCAYTYPITAPVEVRVPLQPKEFEPIMGGEDAWKFAPVENEVTCEECERKGTTAACTRLSSAVLLAYCRSREVRSLAARA
jgi:DNA-directed RNA polymerase subunit M/transcription elongation factor TFIIS